MCVISPEVKDEDEEKKNWKRRFVEVEQKKKNNIVLLYIAATNKGNTIESENYNARTVLDTGS